MNPMQTTETIAQLIHAGLSEHIKHGNA